MKLQKEVISIIKNRQTVKKGAASKKARVKKCEIQGGGQEMAVHDGRLWPKFNNDNSGEFGAES